MPTVDNYREKLGYGARTNLYLVEIRFPTILTAVANAQLEETISILCTSCSFPTSRKITKIAQKYEGTTVGLPGDKEGEPDFTMTFDNEENLLAKLAFETWIDIIQADKTSFRTSPSTFMCPWLAVTRLNHAKEPVKKARILQAWPYDPGEQTELSRVEGGEKIEQTKIVFSTDGHEWLPIK